MTASDPSVAAADPSASAWVAANAGAGKTHTLANRVTRLLLSDVKPARILCLTYTKAAAAEMQHRLFDRLGQWAMQPDEILKKNIQDIGAEANDLPKARRLFAQALETPGGLKILTIHAFCQNLLSRFPVEAGVPPSFDILDDATARELMSAARARVMERAGAGDPSLSIALSFLITETGEYTMTALLDAALGADRRKLDRFFDALEHEDDALYRAIRRVHRAAENGRARDVIAEFCSALKAEAGQLRKLIDWLSGGGTTDTTRAEALARALELDLAVEAYEHISQAFLTKTGERRKSGVTKPLSKAAPELVEVLAALEERFITVEDKRRATHAAELAEAALTLGDAVRRYYAAAKIARGALDYDDLIARTVNLLERGNAAQWILYKLDGGIDHVLIDEAQDTSPEQWRIVKRLTEEFFAGEGQAGGRGQVRTLFAVGDEKQSIFSFQGADPAQFELNRAHFHAAAEAAEHRFVTAPLIQSRRSAPQILTFVDAVFESETARAGLTSDGLSIAHRAHRADAIGCVEFWPALKPADKSERDVWRALRPIDVEAEDSPVVRLAKQIADRIAGWIGKATLPGHDRPIRAGDIMILLRRREPFGPEIVRRLKDRGVPVAGADRMRLTEQIAVMDLIALGRFVLLPEDDYNLAALLRSPLCGVSEEALFDLAHYRAGTLWTALQEQQGGARFAETCAFLNAMRHHADFAPPYEFYAEALDARGMRLALLRRLGAEANDAIDEFLSLSFAYESANTPSLEGFLHWIEGGGAEVKRDMERNRDEVRVMTVHGAKGLEADIVILPDTTTLPQTGNQGGFLFEDGVPLLPVRNIDAPAAVKAAKDVARTRMLEEYRRLLYVALTRARDRLIVCGFENKNGVHEESWYALARRAAEKLGVKVVDSEDAPLVYGEAETVAATTVSSAAAAMALPAWVTAPAPRDTPAPRLVRPFDAAGLDEPAALSPFAENKRFRRGLLVHALLAHLPEVAREGRADVARTFLRRRMDGDVEVLVRETLAVLDDPAFAAAFGEGSRAEVALVADLPELGAGARVNGRVDRLAVNDDRVLIVDFKTNRPPPVREVDVAPLYRVQMALYRAAAQRIFPDRRIECGLVWTDGPTAMMLSNGLLDAEMASIKARLDPTGKRS
jgi:ATP-dependent helicase/nuclease subunit A